MVVENIPKTSEEIVYYKGQASGIEPIIQSVKATAIAVGLAFILSLDVLDPMKRDLGQVTVLLWIFLLLSWGGYVGWAWWGWSNVRYILTNRKITFERGRFGKTIKNIELWRVRELIFQRNFVESIFGIGKITLVSKDLTGPFTLVGPINGAMRVYEALNDAREVAIRERGVMAVEG